MLEPDLLILASAICFVCCLLVYPVTKQSSRSTVTLGNLTLRHVNWTEGLEIWFTSITDKSVLCIVALRLKTKRRRDFPQSLILAFFRHHWRYFNNTHLKQSVSLQFYVNTKTTERQWRWQMRLSSLSGLAYGNNQGKCGSAGPTVISRRPHVHVSFNSATRPTVD